MFLDLANIETIDAAGIGALVSLQAAGIYLKLLNPTERVVDLLRVTKLNSIFEVFRSQSVPEGSELACIMHEAVRSSRVAMKSGW
ncbi:MAG: hypothetical protein NVS1B11_38060 [Terriglobales bacterium]